LALNHLNNINFFNKMDKESNEENSDIDGFMPEDLFPENVAVLILLKDLKQKKDSVIFLVDCN